jgi:DHA2 family multidrug resistance protein
VALSCLFVPLTTITMDPIPREEMGNATSMFNLLRNLGGSMGIAAMTTLLSRHRQMHTNYLVEHVTPYNLQAQQAFRKIQGAMLASGSDLGTATQRTRALLFYSVQRQAAMLSFIDIFRILGIIFLLLLPLVWIMKKPRVGKTDAASSAH